MNINEKILMLRKKEGLSQENLAEKLNVTRQTVSNWESGQTTPDIIQAKEISNIFKISLDDLTDNKLEFDCKDNSNNILKNIINKECFLLIDEDFSSSYISSNTLVKVIEVSNSFIKVEYKKGKQTINKLIDIDIITSIKIVEGDER